MLKRTLINIPDNMYDTPPVVSYSFKETLINCLCGIKRKARGAQKQRRISKMCRSYGAAQRNDSVLQAINQGFLNSSLNDTAGDKTVFTLTIPLITSDKKLMGIIQVIKDEDGNIIPFSPDDEILLSHFANSASAFRERASITKSMILRMIKMAELRDPKETGAHVNRVAGYAIEIYDRWAFHHQVQAEEKEKFRDILKISSMLHDVGKVAISDAILKKPARFTPEEYKVMKNHTVYGASLFSDLYYPADVLSRDIALTHHENWDGTGYPGWVDPSSWKIERSDGNGNPLGKKGEEIPLGGRIVAIADVFDALCSKRVYKEPLSEDEVLCEMKRLSGTKFDPELIEIFFEVLPGIKHIQYEISGLKEHSA